MKTIGLIGGTSWPSTIEYYRKLNELVVERLGGFHSAKLLLKSIDYHDIKSDYAAGWHKVPNLLRDEITEFLTHKPDCLIICNMTLHKAIDLIADDIAISIPFFHAVDLTAKAARAKNYRQVLLLATKFTMDDGFFAKRLESDGLKVIVPNIKERLEIQAIQTELAAGHMKAEFSHDLIGLIKRYSTCDAVVLACTELPLAVTPLQSPLPLLNPVALQCTAAVDFALATS